MKDILFARGSGANDRTMKVQTEAGMKLVTEEFPDHKVTLGEPCLVAYKAAKEVLERALDQGLDAEYVDQMPA